MSEVVLITGVSRFLGVRLAAQLAADPSIERIIGIDTVAPAAQDLLQLGRTEFVRADTRNPLITNVFAQGRVTTVVHAALLSSPLAGGGRVAMQEMNVIGTMQLLAACQKSETLRRVVLRSTAAVYGSGSGYPAIMTEDDPTRGGAGRGYPKDAAEIESYVRGFARRRPDVEISVLRLAKLIGPTIDNQLARYLRSPVVTTIAGYDPRVQLLHESDAVEVLRLATVGSRPGTVNVAGDGVLTLDQAIRRAGRTRIAVPGSALSAVGRLLGNNAAAELRAEDANWLRFGRAVDTTRLHTTFGYTPRYSTDEALDSFLVGIRHTPRIALGTLGVGSALLQARRERRGPLTGAHEGV
ncbi:NAD-dependent epimerase/dehydratase family protein [uncultured Jatrophihabitans sp.]|uniref:NAD-dependent epimerase/dehydratase family protein n=1 Tax=uncultured Jatrophihabitans sp. TaxID=1610747 RepID=UPI0035CC78CB